MALQWTKKVDGHEEDARTVTPWEEREGNGHVEYPDPNQEKK